MGLVGSLGLYSHICKVRIGPGYLEDLCTPYDRFLYVGNRGLRWLNNLGKIFLLKEATCHSSAIVIFTCVIT